jgi:hypothetical protein
MFLLPYFPGEPYEMITETLLAIQKINIRTLLIYAMKPMIHSLRNFVKNMELFMLPETTGLMPKQAISTTP